MEVILKNAFKVKRINRSIAVEHENNDSNHQQKEAKPSNKTHLTKLI